MHFLPVDHSTDDGYLAHGGARGAERTEDTAEVALAAAYDPLDDVFGSTDDMTAADTFLDRQDSASHAHPSDMRRLETEYTTAGYREGVSVSKEKTVQVGFDEGFSLGATIGLSAGLLLGALEGIVDAIKSQGGGDDGRVIQARELLTEAQGELSATKIFSPDYWEADGNWRFDVKTATETMAGKKDTDDGGEKENEEMVLFSHVAKCHPLIHKWTGIIDEQMQYWKIDRSVVDGNDELRTTKDVVVVDEPVASHSAPASKKPLDW